MLFIALLIAILTANTASAQMWANQPKTITYFDNKTKEKIGTAIISQGGRLTVLRDRHGEHYATVIREHGTTRFVDPDGKPLDPKTTKLPLD